MKETKIKKTEQTEAWAIGQMNIWNNRIYGLNDISKKYHTRKLFEAAILHGNARIKDVPESMLTPEMCLNAIRNRGTPQEFASIPERFLDHAFMKAVISREPQLFDAVFYTARKGREGTAYSSDDIDLVMEGICPRAFGSEAAEDEGIKFEESPAFENYCIEQGAIFSSHQRFPRKLLFEALMHYAQDKAPAISQKDQMDNEQRNTLFLYRCTDPEGFKVQTETVLPGTASKETMERFTEKFGSTCHSFVPEQIGLDALRGINWNPDNGDDYECEFDGDTAFTVTSEKPSVDICTETVLNRIMDVNEWDFSGKQNVSMNTRISYLYRDADNYKIHTTVVLSGRLSEAEKQRIYDCLEDGELFKASYVGLPANRFDTITESDTDFFELQRGDIEDTTVPPSDECSGLSASQLLDLFEQAAANHWSQDI